MNTAAENRWEGLGPEGAGRVVAQELANLIEGTANAGHVWLGQTLVRSFGDVDRLMLLQIAICSLAGVAPELPEPD